MKAALRGVVAILLLVVVSLPVFVASGDDIDLTDALVPVYSY